MEKDWKSVVTVGREVNDARQSVTSTTKHHHISTAGQNQLKKRIERRKRLCYVEFCKRLKNKKREQTDTELVEPSMFTTWGRRR